MFNPLLERRDYGGNQLEKQPDFNNLLYRAKNQAKNIHDENLSKMKIKNLLIKNHLYNVNDQHIVDVREYISDGYSLERAINKVVLDQFKKNEVTRKETDKSWLV